MSEADMQLETVELRVHEGAATIELNRPEALNAWNQRFGEDLLAAVRHAAADELDPGGGDHRRRTGLLFRRRPEGHER